MIDFTFFSLNTPKPEFISLPGCITDCSSLGVDRFQTDTVTECVVHDYHSCVPASSVVTSCSDTQILIQ